MFPKDPHRLWVSDIDMVHHMSTVWATAIGGVNISEAAKDLVTAPCVYLLVILVAVLLRRRHLLVSRRQTS